jgi:hypothetical protein
MRLLQVLLFLALVVFANGGKVKWNSNGKPTIEPSSKPVKGCNKAKLEDLTKDNNSSKCKG